MEGQHHKKRAVRIAKKGVAPSPHVLHLGRPIVPEIEPPLVTPRSLSVEVALDNIRAEIRHRVHDTAREALHQMVRGIRAFRPRMPRRKKQAIAHIEAVVEHAVPEIAVAVEHAIEERLPIRKKIATWLSGRVTASHVHMPPRRLSIAFFVALLVLMAMPVGLMKLYQSVRIQKAQFQEQKILMLALAGTVKESLSRGDFAAAENALTSLDGALLFVEGSMDAIGPLTYVPPMYQAYQGIQAARESVRQGGVALAGIKRFPWSQSSFTAARAALSAAERAARNLGQARIGFDAAPAQGYIRLVDDSLTLAQTFVGGEDGRYLVVFQNENELRPTGGFMGSFAVLTLNDGSWSIEMPSQGSYALQGWLTKSVRAPKPLSLVNARFEFQDVNWFPHFPTTAEKIMSFYEEGGGSSVDGVIAVNSSFLNDVMALAGPLTVPEISAQALQPGTVVESLEKAIARDRATAAPKAVLGGLLDALMDRFQSGDIHPVALGRVSLAALAEKNIQLYFRDNARQTAAARLGFDGALPRDWDKDFFMMVSANVAGGKTDGAIRDAIDYNVTVDESGQLIAHVTLTRTHEGLRGDPLRGVRNVSYVRFYSPAGSEFVGATGFSQAPSWRFENPTATLVPDEDVRAGELTEKQDAKSGTIVAEEHKKTVFGNWLMVDPGEVKTVQLKYRLPERVARDARTRYALMALKQSGRDTSFHFTMNAPGFSIVSLPDGTVSREGYSRKTTLATDSVTRLELAP